MQVSTLHTVLLGTACVLSTPSLDRREKRQAECFSTCRPKVQCAGTFTNLLEASQQQCDLPQGKLGFCCSDVTARPSVARPEIDIRHSGGTLPRPAGVDDGMIKETLAEVKIPEKAFIIEDKETQGHRLFTRAREEDQDIRDAAFKLLKLGENLGIDLRQSFEGVDAENSIDVENICPWKGKRRPKCGPQDDEYRTVDGSCNNKFEPLFGMSRTPMQRILRSTYGRRNLPRTKSNGKQLPSARLISSKIFTAADPTNQDDISTLFMQMGQFIDHDITHGPATERECCKKDGAGRHWVYPSDPYNSDPVNCFPIEVPVNDPFWGRKGRTCMEFSRTTISPTIPNCEGGKREQMNAITHWLDASTVYGSTEKESREVRDAVDRSLLKTEIKGRLGLGRSLLPQCSKARSTKIEACQEICGCAFAGDFRVNEQPGLSTMHTIWVREHNRIAGELGAMNSHWEGEKIFQEARKIVIAQWQHIVYNEWLPIVVGKEYMQTFGLLPTTDEYTQDYDASIDPRINNEFAAAAFRFGHSMIPSHFPSRDSTGRDTSSSSLKNVFNKPFLLQEASFIENMLRGQSQEDAPAWDPAFNEDIMNHLFEDDDNGGLDLSSLNIQRARDHGIPGYNKYREICASGSFGAADNFNGLFEDGYLSNDDIRKLSLVYDDVEDIDLYVGSILEKPHKDSLVGRTFKCIIGDQFIRLKQGDRFWYENGGENAQFSFTQLRAIKTSSMARIICDNTDIRQMQPMAFRTATGVNSLADCQDKITIPSMDLAMWMEGV
eukprot:GFUD01044196.1.p1 GENE.GFUD01044196.1~~GFUD01044196.1.p1  ORF type:complete len:777 (+),score=180.51 GFUD01044196.1:168-2498(+)